MEKKTKTNAAMRWVVLFENALNPGAADLFPREFTSALSWNLYTQILSRESSDRSASVIAPPSVQTALQEAGALGEACPAGEWHRAVDRKEERTCKPCTVVSNGRYLKRFDEERLLEHAALFSWDVLAVRIVSVLGPGSETVRMTPRGRVVGFRRLYVPGIEPDVPQTDWPTLLYFKRSAWDRLETDPLGKDYNSLLNRLERLNLRVRHVRYGGQVWDLGMPGGWFELLEQTETVALSPPHQASSRGQGVRLIGNVHIGRNVRLGDNCTIVAPAVLSDGVTVGRGALLRNTWVGSQVTVPESYRGQNQVLWRTEGMNSVWDAGPEFTAAGKTTRKRVRRPFRNWPAVSYPGWGKRMFDLVVSCAVLVLFLPFLLIIAAVTKLTSPGPVFYRARRQGLHGKEFDCLKFRTMMVQADAIQERLRMANQVDGPQFKIEDDPRITQIGKFLRDTSIDEIPQFFNVLKGEMSVVGPRPSPESENETCPYWRDARLSVRPGITGLWQVMRTRQASMDFQEWIYYDTTYVRQISFLFDIWICLKTARKLIHSFLDQFG